MTNTFAFVDHLEDISRVAPASEALLRVYNTQLTLTHKAGELLGLQDESKVVFRVGEASGTRRLYVGRKETNGYTVVKVGRRYKVYGSDLCRSIADLLQGYGTYRIEADNRVFDHNGDALYSVFFRKYD